MRAFSVAWRAVASVYEDLFLLIGMSLLWWVTGGVFVAAAVAVGAALFATEGPWWLAPLIAIPAAPANVALAAICRRVARGQPADRLDYVDALKRGWRRGLGIAALGMVVLTLALLNAIFYLYQSNMILRLLAILWIYVTVLWASMQLYIYPFFVALEPPNVWRTFKLAGLAALANPLFSMLLLLLAVALTAACVALPILALLVWPALMALLGEWALRLMLQRAGMEKDDAAARPIRKSR